MEKRIYRKPVVRALSVGTGEVMQMIHTSKEIVTGHAKQQGFTGAWDNNSPTPIEDWK